MPLDVVVFVPQGWQVRWWSGAGGPGSGCDPKIAPQARVPRAAPGGRPHDRHAGQAVSVGGRMHSHCRRSDRGGSSIDRWERMERAQGSDGGGERTGRERERERVRWTGGATRGTSLMDGGPSRSVTVPGATVRHSQLTGQRASGRGACTTGALAMVLQQQREVQERELPRSRVRAWAGPNSERSRTLSGAGARCQPPVTPRGPCLEPRVCLCSPPRLLRRRAAAREPLCLSL